MPHPVPFTARLTCLCVLASLALACASPAPPGGFASPDGTAANPADASAADTQVAQGVPKAQVSPVQGTFPYTPVGSSKTESFAVTNVGSGTLLVDRIDVFGNKAFTLAFTGNGGLPMPTTGDKLVFNPPLAIAAGGSAPFTVQLTVQDAQPTSASLLVQTNDPSKPKGIEVKLSVAGATPCLQFQPGAPNFGSGVVGSTLTKALVVSNCGVVDVAMTGMQLAGGAGSKGLFSVEFGSLAATCPGLDPLTGPTAGKPCVLAPGTSAALQVSYSPAPGGGTDTATLHAKIKGGTKSVALSGTSVDAPVQACPKAKVQVKEGEEVIPETQLHLKGDGSAASSGAKVAKFKWTVTQPPGSIQTFVPNAGFPNPSFTANVAGTYKFCLEVWDDTGVKSCLEGCKDVLVVPTAAIHLELLWNTPSDPDQSDSGPGAGADMDLHFAHQKASGPDVDCDGVGDPWFSNPFDMFWFNPNPAWGSTSPLVNDDPSLDLDDTDGAGPENANLDAPEGSAADPIWYAIGVHYWNPQSFGVSTASVFVYVQGSLVMQSAKVPLKGLDMWYVGKVHWPNALSGGTAPVFTPCLQSGNACTGAGKLWQATGTPCITPCYENKAFTASAGGAAPAKCKP